MTAILKLKLSVWLPDTYFTYSTLLNISAIGKISKNKVSKQIKKQQFIKTTLLFSSTFILIFFNNVTYCSEFIFTQYGLFRLLYTKSY
jgi:hypothetical protein